MKYNETNQIKCKSNKYAIMQERRLLELQNNKKKQIRLLRTKVIVTIKEYDSGRFKKCDANFSKPGTVTP